MAAAPPTINRTMTPVEWALLLTLSLLWGGSFFFNAVALTGLPPFVVVTARVTLGALLLYAAVRATGAKLPADGQSWRAFAVMGILNNVVPFSLIVWSQTAIASGLASILNATTPLFTVVVAHALTRDERMTPGSVIGTIVGLVGVTVMIGIDTLADAGDHLLAELAVLAASLSYALSVVYARRFARRGFPPLVSATGQITAAAAMMIVLSAIVDRPWTLPMPGIEVWGALAGLAGLATFLAYIIYYRILATAGSVNLMLVTFLIPVTAVLLGALILAERLEVHHFVGMAAIGVGLAAIDGRPVRLLRRRVA